jgi:hypothetical protein
LFEDRAELSALALASELFVDRPMIVVAGGFDSSSSPSV